MSADTRERIERLRALGAMDDTYDIVSVFMNGSKLGAFSTDKLIHDLIDLLKRSDPTDWTDEQLSEYGLVRLPRDKDGEFVHLNDTVWDSDGNECTVDSIECPCSGQWYAYCVRTIGYTTGGNSCPTSELTHHPPVTVESVLREFAEESSSIGMCGELDVLVAEYASRLRLA